ncbi:MAG: TIM barrel protein [Planctomycetota bacterium]
MPAAPPLVLGVTAVMLPELDFDEQIALCVDCGVTAYVFRPRVIPDRARDQPYSNWGNHRFDLTPQRLADEGQQLAARLLDAGINPVGTVPAGANGDDEDAFRLDLAGAAAGRCRHMRIQLPAMPDGLFDWPDYLAKTRDRLARLIELATPYGVKLVIEMHAGSAAVDAVAARNLCDGFDPDRLGLIFDLPNLSREGIRHAELTLSAIRPYIDHAHVGGFTHHPATPAPGGDRPRDDAGFAKPAGTMSALSDGDLHTPTWLALLREAAPHAELIVEDYTPDKPGADRLRDTVHDVRRALAQSAG